MKNYEGKVRRMRERGITLVALVVTIVILLILVGVTLNLTARNKWIICKNQKCSRKI